MMQQNSADFEEGIVRSIQSAWVTFDEWQSRAATSSQDTFRTLGNQMAALQPDKEWISFAARSDHLLDPDTPLRDPEAILYPLKDDSSVIPVHTGYLERKQRFTRTYKEGYFILTPAGFLHSFANSDLAKSSTPTFSIFLPLCTLGPPSTPSSKSNKFHIEGKKDGLGTTKGGTSLKSIFSSDSQRAWSFRARSREELMEWWNDIRMLCARYLVASEQMERTGPVEAAVRAVGYVSDEEEEDWDGSSVEEEAAEDDGEDEIYEDVMEDGPPGYHHPAHHEKVYAGEVNQNGYLVDKKVLPGHYPEAEQQGAPITRRPSKRQQEKAPEGRQPHMYPDHDEAPVIDRDTGAPGRNTTPPGPSTSYQAVPVSIAKNNASHIVDLGQGGTGGSVIGSARGSAHGGSESGEGMKPISANPTGNTDAGPAPVESRFQEGL
ncbi:hypothetical protein BDQ17DRAFT_342710 [Cyathus striatus]|nr:hypothetical protein BDQ17DRAFT_342710 [Cyathus striatus]